MTALAEAVGDYLSVRRALGAKLAGHDRLLADFVSYLQDAGSERVTTELALAWAGRPGPDAHPAYLAGRLCVVRGFARHLLAFDPATEVPPAELMPWRPCRATPYLYSSDEVASLMTAAASLAPRLRAATYETLVGLLKVTGLRIGEAIRLKSDDVDWDEGLLTIWDSKFGKSREVPLHPSTLDALRAYTGVRDELCPHPKATTLLLSAAGDRLAQRTVQTTFARLLREAGITPRSSHCRPRLHDFRHSMAVETLLGWYRAGIDVEPQLALLSTFLGHADPGKTYWYLSAVPELLALAGRSAHDRA